MPKKEKPKRSGLEGILQNAVGESRAARAEIEEFLIEHDALPWEETVETSAPPDLGTEPSVLHSARTSLGLQPAEKPDEAGAHKAPPARRFSEVSLTQSTPPQFKSPQTALDQIRTVPLKTARPDRRKREPVVSYRGIPETLQRNLERLADERDLPVGVLARYFLEHGLQETDAGGMSLAPQLVRVGLTLYPEVEGNAPRLRRRRTGSTRGAAPKKSARPVAFRGIPQETARAVAELANRLGVPIGEVARYFLEAGIQQVRSGTLQLQTFPLPSALRTLYPEE